MKKLLVTLLFMLTFLNAEKAATKVGCLLSQDGVVSVNWSTKDGENGSFKKVKYSAVKKEGINFKEIFVGSSILVHSSDKPIKLTIKEIKANPRVKPNPRTGTMTINMQSEGLIKKVMLNYTYAKNVMKVAGEVNAFGFKSIGFQTKIKAVLCEIKTS